MNRMSRTQVHKAYKLLCKRDQWFRKNHLPLQSWQRHPRPPTELLLAEIAKASGMSVSTLRRLEYDEFAPSRRTPAEIRKWIGSEFPTKSSNQGLAGYIWRKKRARKAG